MSPIIARSTGFCLAALFILLAASSEVGGTCTISVSDSGAVLNANGIFVSSGKAYIASEISHGKLFVMPVSPISSGDGYDVSNQAMDVFVSGNIAYMTEKNNGVEVVNAENGAHLGW